MITDNDRASPVAQARQHGVFKDGARPAGASAESSVGIQSILPHLNGTEALDVDALKKELVDKMSGSQ